jgi:hypothetical protein
MAGTYGGCSVSLQLGKQHSHIGSTSSPHEFTISVDRRCIFEHAQPNRDMWFPLGTVSHPDSSLRSRPSLKFNNDCVSDVTYFYGYDRRVTTNGLYDGSQTVQSARMLLPQYLPMYLWPAAIFYRTILLRQSNGF